MLNRFDSPISEGVYRALLQTGATFAVSCGTLYLTLDRVLMPAHDRWEIAIITGLITALAPFSVGSLIAKSDQNRAEKNAIKPADVPVAAVRG